MQRGLILSAIPLLASGLAHAQSPDDRTLPPPSASTAGYVSKQETLPALLAGVGGLGVGGFLALAAWGRSSELRLQDSCAPHCSEAQISRLKTHYLVADVSLGVGVVSLATGIYLFLTSPAKAPPIQAVRIDLRASSGSLSATYGGVF